MEAISAFFSEHRWIYEVFGVVFVTLVIAFVQRRVLKRLHRRLESTKTPWDDALVEAAQRPLSLLIWVIGIAFAAELVEQQAPSALFEAVDPLRDVAVVWVIAWFLVRFVRHAERNLLHQGEIQGRELDRTTLDAIAKLLRVSVLITAVLVALQTLGFSISGVLAFGGVGGIAVGFAAKDLLANFFGGLMIYLDRPFAVGDWVRSPDRELEGTVEDIGWRLTRIRTFDLRPIYVPNSAFTTIVVENPSRMLNRRIYETIGVRYGDVASLPAIVGDITKMLREHPEIDQHRTMMVNFNKFSDSSLDFFVYTFTKTISWTRFHEIKQEILFTISEIIASHDAEIAFPTSTVHLEGDKAAFGPRKHKV